MTHHYAVYAQEWEGAVRPSTFNLSKVLRTEEAALASARGEARHAARLLSEASYETRWAARTVVRLAGDVPSRATMQELEAVGGRLVAQFAASSSGSHLAAYRPCYKTYRLFCARAQP